MAGDRYRIGFCIDFLGSPYHKALYAGVEEACKQYDCDLVCYVTGRLGSELESEKCRNILLDLVSKQNVHGLVLAVASILNLANDDQKKYLIESLDHLPVSIIGELDFSHDHITAKSKGDLGLVMSHLIDFHGYVNLAFVGGTSGNSEAQARRASFESHAKSHGIELVPEWLFEGDFRPESGRRAVLEMLKSGRLPEAIVCANDAMAWGAMACLREHGIAPGFDVAVTGYDDLTTSAALGLTTMKQSLQDKSRLATEALILKIEQRPFADRLEIAEQTIIRQSCGCRHRLRHEPLQEGEALRDFDETYRKIEAEVLRMGSLHLGDIVTLQMKMGGLIEDSLLGLPQTLATPLRSRLSNLTESMTNNSEVLTNSDHDWRFDEINDKAEKIASCLELPHLFAVLKEEMPAMNIPLFHAALFGPNSETLSLDQRLSVGFNASKPVSGTVIVPPEVFDSVYRQSFIVHALFHGFEPLGVAVFSQGARDLNFYEHLRVRISLSLKACKLVGALKSYAEDLEVMVQDRTKALQVELESRKRAEQEVRRSEEHIRELAMLVPGIVIELDGRLNITFINHAGLQIIGCKPPVKGQAPVSLLDHLTEASRPQVRELLKGLLVSSGNESMQTELHIEKGQAQKSILLVTVRARGVLGQDRGIYLSAMDLNPLLDSAVVPDHAFFEHFHLSPRVREVFELMIRGLDIEDIGLELGISTNTVKVHIHSIYIATGVKNRKELFDLLKDYQKRDFGYGSLLHSLLAGVVSSKKTVS